jgi:hypothetical protein
MLEAANMFKKAIDKIAIRTGYGTLSGKLLIKTYQDYQFGERGNSNKVYSCRLGKQAHLIGE